MTAMLVLCMLFILMVSRNVSSSSFGAGSGPPPPPWCPPSAAYDQRLALCRRKIMAQQKEIAELRFDLAILGKEEDTQSIHYQNLVEAVERLNELLDQEFEEEEMARVCSHYDEAAISASATSSWSPSSSSRSPISSATHESVAQGGSDIGISPVPQQKTEVELLFDLFPEWSRHTVFGYKSFDQFQANVPRSKWQEHFSGTKDYYKLFDLRDDGQNGYLVEMISVFEHEMSDRIEINWDVLKQFQSLKELSIKGPVFGGPVSMSDLPPTLEKLTLSCGKFGPFDFHGIPPGLLHLDLSNNGASGVLDVRKLPDTLKTLELKGNYIVPVRGIRFNAK